MSVEITEEENSEEGFTMRQWIETPPETFDLTDEYTEQVLPLVKAVEDKCHELGIPFYFRATLQCDTKCSSSRTTCFLGGPGKATPEMLAAMKLEDFGVHFAIEMFSLQSACSEKYSRLAEQEVVNG